MQHPETKVLAVIAITMLLALGLAIPRQKTFNARWADDMMQLSTVQPSIPQEKLHARALQILREMTVAKDCDVAADRGCVADTD